MLKKYYLLVSFCLSSSLIFGKHVILETSKTKYIAQTQDNKSKQMTEHGADYADEVGWLDQCSLNSATGDTKGNGRGRGKRVAKDVFGCSEIEMKCTGGCLKILKGSFLCKKKVQSAKKVRRLLRNECGKKDHCNVSPIKQTFAFIKCPDADRSVEILYRCDGGQDRTSLVKASCGNQCVGDDCGTCGNEKRGQMVQKDLIGGSKLTITCVGGCIKIMKVLYSCKIGKSSKDSQLKIVKGLCEDGNKCEVSATREMFGYEECPDKKLEEEMNLWIMYRCDGGEDIIRPKKEKKKVCGNGRTGKMVQQDLKGGNTLTITCVGGCIKIMKVLYSCKKQKSSNASQLRIVEGLCEDNNKCEFSASRKIFGDTECPGRREEEMKLWVVYRCDGGKDISR